VRVNNFIGTCPEGWRVPEVVEWKNMATNNSMKNLFESKDNFTYGVKIGENLVLPISGNISSYGSNKFPSKDNYAYRWAKDYNFEIDSNYYTAYVAKFNELESNSGVETLKSMYLGLSIRCVKD